MTEYADYSPASARGKAMYNGINELIDDLMDHISLENNVLFPRALAGE